MATTRQPNRPSGETEGSEQEPNEISDRDPMQTNPRTTGAAPDEPDAGGEQPPRTEEERSA